MKSFRVLKPAEVARALRKYKGLASPAAKSLGCSLQTIYNHIRKHPEVAEAQQEATEVILDLAEEKLFNAVNKGESWGVTFVLARKGRHHGYGEKLDVTSGNKPLSSGLGEVDAVLAKLGAAGLKRLIEELNKK